MELAVQSGILKCANYCCPPQHSRSPDRAEIAHPHGNEIHFQLVKLLNPSIVVVKKVRGLRCRHQ